MRKFAFTLTAAVLLGGSVNGAVAADEKPASVIETKSVLLLTDDSVAEIQESDEKSEESDKESSDEADGKTEKKEVSKKQVIVEVQSESNSSSDDDESKPAKVRGRIIMIGPDGQRKEVELDEKQLKTFEVEGVNGLTLKSGDGEEKSSEEGKFEERFVIGVQCEEADDVLRKHLKLDGQGLLVLEVREKTPAADAGLEVDDVIVAVGEKTLHSRDDLVTAVLESEGKELDVRIIRAGDETTVKVTPKKMKVPVVNATINVQGFPMPNVLQQGKVALPGVVIDGVPQDPKALRQLIERLQKDAILEQRDALLQQKMMIEDEAKSSDEMEELRKELRELKDEIDALRKAREK